MCRVGELILRSRAVQSADHNGDHKARCPACFVVDPGDKSSEAHVDVLFEVRIPVLGGQRCIAAHPVHDLVNKE